MSDSSPLLLEMGSQVQGNGPALPLQGGQTGEDAGFSGVLQSALQKVAATPGMEKMAQANGLQAELLAQSLAAGGNGGDIIVLSRQTTTEILPLQGGNALPLIDMTDAGQELLDKQQAVEGDSLEAESLQAELEPNLLLASDADKDAKQSAQTSEAEQEHEDVHQDLQQLMDERASQESQDAAILSDMNKTATPSAAPVQGENPALQQTAKSLNQNSEKASINPLEGTRTIKTDGNVDDGEQLARATLEKHQSLDTASPKTQHTTLNPDSRPVHDSVDTNLPTSTSSVDSSAARLNPNAALAGATAYAAISNTGAHSSTQPWGQNIGGLTIPPDNPAWPNFVGDRVQWMVGQDIQQAHIKLNPPELGALEISVHVGHDKQTTVSFSSPHAQVRDALEAAAPRLREMFGNNGLSLGDVNVSHQSMSQQQHAHRDETASGSSQNRREGVAMNDAVVAGPSPVISQGKGMLDLYA